MQGPNSPPTRGSRWMTAGPVQDADLDTGTVARVVTKPFIELPASCGSAPSVDRPVPHLVGQGI